MRTPRKSSLLEELRLVVRVKRKLPIGAMVPRKVFFCGTHTDHDGCVCYSLGWSASFCDAGFSSRGGFRLTMVCARHSCQRNVRTARGVASISVIKCFLGLVHDCRMIARSFFKQPLPYLPYLGRPCKDWKPFLGRSLSKLIPLDYDIILLYDNSINQSNQV